MFTNTNLKFDYFCIIEYYKLFTSAIEDGIGHIAHLGSGGPRLLDHALKHLSGANDGLAHFVAPGYHHLLRDKHLLRRYFNAQIASRHHDTVGGGQNLIKTINEPKIR